MPKSKTTTEATSSQPQPIPSPGKSVAGKRKGKYLRCLIFKENCHCFIEGSF